MRKPPIGEVWLHVDRFDKTDGKTWAVQWREGKGKPRYECFVDVAIVECSAVTREFKDPKRKRPIQPRGVIAIPGGRVVVRGPNAIITVRG